MKLGEKVLFIQHLIKNHESGEWVDNEGEPVEFEKRVIKELTKPHEGIIVGKRRVGKVSTFQWQDFVNYNGESYEDGRWNHTGTQFETVYLVACNLNRFYMVRPDDLVVSGIESHKPPYMDLDD